MYMSILIAFYSYYMNRKPGAMLHGSAIQNHLILSRFFDSKKFFQKISIKVLTNGIPYVKMSTTKQETTQKPND